MRSLPAQISPRVGVSRPAIRRSNVDLPQPLGPTSVTISPAATDSAANSVRNDVPSPMKTPTKMLGMAAGIAIRKTRNHRLAPSVRATSRYDVGTLETPDVVNIVTGNQTASAMRAMTDMVAL